MYRIMIVEDDEVIARAVQQSLVSWGMDAFCVQDCSRRICREKSAISADGHSSSLF